MMALGWDRDLPFIGKTEKARLRKRPRPGKGNSTGSGELEAQACHVGGIPRLRPTITNTADVIASRHSGQGRKHGLRRFLQCLFPPTSRSEPLVSCLHREAAYWQTWRHVQQVVEEVVEEVREDVLKQLSAYVRQEAVDAPGNYIPLTLAYMPSLDLPGSASRSIASFLRASGPRYVVSLRLTEFSSLALALQAIYNQLTGRKKPTEEAVSQGPSERSEHSHIHREGREKESKQDKDHECGKNLLPGRMTDVEILNRPRAAKVNARAAIRAISDSKLRHFRPMTDEEDDGEPFIFSDDEEDELTLGGRSWGSRSTPATMSRVKRQDWMAAVADWWESLPLSSSSADKEEKALGPVCIVFEEVEAAETSLLTRLLYTLSAQLSHLPLHLIFSMTSAARDLHSRLPHSVLIEFKMESFGNVRTEAVGRMILERLLLGSSRKQLIDHSTSQPTCASPSTDPLQPLAVQLPGPVLSTLLHERFILSSNSLGSLLRDLQAVLRVHFGHTRGSYLASIRWREEDAQENREEESETEEEEGEDEETAVPSISEINSYDLWYLTRKSASYSKEQRRKELRDAVQCYHAKRRSWLFVFSVLFGALRYLSGLHVERNEERPGKKTTPLERLDLYGIALQGSDFILSSSVYRKAKQTLRACGLKQLAGLQMLLSDHLVLSELGENVSFFFLKAIRSLFAQLNAALDDYEQRGKDMTLDASSQASSPAPVNPAGSARGLFLARQGIESKSAGSSISAVSTPIVYQTERSRERTIEGQQEATRRRAEDSESRVQALSIYRTSLEHLLDELCLMLDSPSSWPLSHVFLAPEALCLYELKTVLSMQMRRKLLNGLESQEYSLRCDCCHDPKQDQGTSATMEDIVIAYRLLVENGEKNISLSSWYDSYLAVYNDEGKTERPDNPSEQGRGRQRRKRSRSEDTRKEETSEESLSAELLLARFTRAVSELQFMGIVRPFGKQGDTMERLVYKS